MKETLIRFIFQIIPQMHFDIFPSPTNDLLHINITNNNDNFLIVDCIGQEKIKGILNKNQNEIDVSSLNNGIYFLIINKPNFSKILIIH